MGHVLDDCVNDGVTWRASVDPSRITGTFLEFLLPFDDENYEEGDQIPAEHREIYDLYVVNESALVPGLAELLARWAAFNGSPDLSSAESPTRILERFALSQAAIPEDLPPGRKLVELSFSTRDGNDWIPAIQVDLATGELQFEQE